jgi:aminoglycoside phosphotransferase
LDGPNGQRVSFFLGIEIYLFEQLTHGDFWLGNVLFDGDDVSGVIDWEGAQMDGLRVVDGLHMLLMSCAVAQGASLAHYLCQLWADEIDDVALQQRIAKLCSQSGIDREDLNLSHCCYGLAFFCKKQ